MNFKAFLESDAAHAAELEKTGFVKDLKDGRRIRQAF